jgi:hypothetical protein
VVQGEIVRFGKCIGADVQLGLDLEVFKVGGIALMSFDVN